MNELRTREDADAAPGPDIMRVYEWFALHGGAPEILREYLYNTTGRCLP